MSDGKQRGPASRVQQMTHLLDADPALGEVLSAARRSEARAAAVAPVVTLGIGSCDLDALLAGAPAGFGLLVLAGVLACHITVNGLHAIEFAGAGDVLLPGAMPATMIQCTRRWEVLDGARVALLDTDFALRVRPWPEIPAALLRRASERGDALAYQLAARQAVRVEDRLVLILWQLAERWGRVSPQGTVLRMPGLNHEVLARVVGARRSPVTKALGDLRRRGVVDTGAKGELVLRRAE